MKKIIALYMNFASKAEYSEDIFIEFQNAMRTLDVECPFGKPA
ncbi:hypothetical protein [Desulfobacula sp.]